MHCVRSKRFRKWRSVYSTGSDMHSMSVHLLQPCSSTTNVRTSVSKRRPLASCNWSSVCLHRVTGKLSIITGNAADETSIADAIQCFRSRLLWLTFHECSSRYSRRSFDFPNCWIMKNETVTGRDYSYLVSVRIE